MKRFCLAALLVLLSVELAQSASRVWITEFATARVEAAAPFAQLPSMVKQPVLDIAAGRVASLPFSASTRYIRIVCEVQCAISATTAAATSDVLLPALRPEYFGVAAGRTISVIAAP
jgi:hypothetical protein